MAHDFASQKSDCYSEVSKIKGCQLNSQASNTCQEWASISFEDLSHYLANEAYKATLPQQVF